MTRTPRLCSIDGCNRKHHAAGLCQMHYSRVKRGQELNTPHNWDKTDEERFFSYVKLAAPDKCWEWAGALFTNGYGSFWFGGKNIKASRFAYKLHYGTFNEYLLVCHKCDNPKCINPSHLFLGTQQDNILDCVAKGRHKNQWSQS